MRKTALFITLLLLAISFSSCKEDGIYDPKEKIDKIYVKYNSNKYLSEDWTWKDNKLKTIAYYSSDGDLASTDRFSYNDKRLIQVDNHEEEISMRYNYDNSDRLLKASFSEDGILSIVYEFEYDGSKISDIHVTLYDEDMDFKNSSNILRFILPEPSLKYINKILKKTVTRKNSKAEIDLIWEGDNISEMAYTIGNYSERSTFEYDDKSNPFRNFLGVYFEENLFEHGNFACENNITKITFSESYNGVSSTTDMENITYTYDGKFPTTRSYDSMTEYFEYE